MDTHVTPSERSVTIASFLGPDRINAGNPRFMKPFTDLLREVGPYEALKRLYCNFGVEDVDRALSIMRAAGVSDLDLEAACLPLVIEMEGKA